MGIKCPPDGPLPGCHAQVASLVPPQAGHGRAILGDLPEPNIPTDQLPIALLLLHIFAGPFRADSRTREVEPVIRLFAAAMAHLDAKLGRGGVRTHLGACSEPADHFGALELLIAPQRVSLARFLRRCFGRGLPWNSHLLDPPA